MNANAAKAVRVLNQGGVIVFPTDTAYGIGCDATDASAVRRVFRIKGRQKGKPFPMIVADLAMAKKYFKLDSRHLPLVTRHWPGPLSLVLSVRSKKIAKDSLYRGTAAVRVPASRIARELSHRLGKPLIATSANLSGEPPAYSVRALSKTLAVDAIMDAGRLPRRNPSTIIRIDAQGTIHVLRKGPIRIT